MESVGFLNHCDVFASDFATTEFSRDGLLKQVLLNLESNDKDRVRIHESCIVL